MPVRRDQSHIFPFNVSGMIDPDGYSRNETHSAADINDERTLALDCHPDSFPSEEFAAYFWPPSVYEAAQYVYPTALALRQLVSAPFDNLAIPVAEPWQLAQVSEPFYQERSRSLESLQADNTNRAYCSRSFAESDLYAASSSTIDDAEPSESYHTNDPECISVKPATNKTSLRCPTCVDKSPFTGQYAQRNLNRHMEKHNSCIGTKNGRHVRCGQPGCTSTFGREDALLVHLRRSHPELNTPPAKKRKRE